MNLFLCMSNMILSIVLDFLELFGQPKRDYKELINAI
jgi:hypothetical protein